MKSLARITIASDVFVILGQVDGPAPSGFGNRRKMAEMSGCGCPGILGKSKEHLMRWRGG
jgi:hypothetical protein